MKEANQNSKEREIAEEQIDFRALLFKYIIHWPWFVGAVLLCLVGAWFYLHWATPIYNISATVLMKDEKKGGGAGLSSELEDMGLRQIRTGSKRSILEKNMSHCEIFWQRCAAIRKQMSAIQKCQT